APLKATDQTSPSQRRTSVADCWSLVAGRWSGRGGAGGWLGAVSRSVAGDHSFPVLSRCSARPIHPGMSMARNCAGAASSSGTALAGVAPAGAHQRLVVVDDRAQRARTLLVEDAARFIEPLPCFVVSVGECTKSSQREARVGVVEAEVWREDLLTQVALEHVD